MKHGSNVKNFLKRVGIPDANLHFCADRRDKAAILHEINATHHIDDKPEVIANLYMDDNIQGILFRPQPTEVVEYFDYLKIRKVSIVHSWEQIEQFISEHTGFPVV